jgi:stearoyl-CoA 9-desaturase NADPH oxidoreductase
MSTEVLPRRRALRRVVTVADALAAPHGVDRFVELVAPRWSSTEVRARIVAVRRSATTSATVWLAPNGNWTGFEAGQHVQLSVEIDGRRHTRCYSMANSAVAGDGLVELTVKAHPEGRVSRFVVDEARPGLVVGLSAALGDFVLPASRPERIVLVSGGSGITPVVSILRTLCDEGHPGPVSFLHYNDEPAAHPYRRELEALASAHPNVLVRTGYALAPAAGDVQGLFTEAHLTAADPRWREAEAFACGPAPLMDAVRRAYAGAGRLGAYHDEAFAAPAPSAHALAGGGTVTFERAGLQVADDGRPLLVQAEAAGLAPSHGCRMGICHTCTRVLRCGAVRDLTTGEVVDQPGAPIRICMSAPEGDVAVDL